MKKGQKIKVIKEVFAAGALIPVIGTEGIVSGEKRNNGEVYYLCYFQPPFKIQGGGTALIDDRYPKGVPVYFTSDEIEEIT